MCGLLLSRADVIVRGGRNISPDEVERALRSHPSIRDVAVVGIPDAALGQRVAALIQPEEGATTEALPSILVMAHEKLASHKVPDRVKFVAAIPRDALGKIDRKALAALLTREEIGPAAAR